MSSPARRSTRSSQAGTPARNTRSSQARSSPAPGPSDAAEAETPRRTRASQLASSPMFYESSPANGGADAAPSSPLRQMSNSQTTDNGPAPSSPLRQQTESQTINDGERTPRASGVRIGGRTTPSLVELELFFTNNEQTLRLFAMTPVQALATPKQTYEARVAVSSSILPEELPVQGVAIFIPSILAGHPYPRVASFLAPMAGLCKMHQSPTLPPFPTTTQAHQTPTLWVVKARAWYGEPPLPSMTHSTLSRTS